MLPTQGTTLYTLRPTAALLEAVVTGHHPARPLQQALPQQCMTVAFSGSAQVTLHHLSPNWWSTLAVQHQYAAHELPTTARRAQQPSYHCALTVFEGHPDQELVFMKCCFAGLMVTITELCASCALQGHTQVQATMA